MEGVPVFGPFDDYHRPILPSGHPLKGLLVRTDEACTSAVAAVGEVYEGCLQGLPVETHAAVERLGQASELLEALRNGIEIAR